MSPSDFADMADELPFIDEHQVVVAAPASAVWQALTEYLDGMRTDGAQAVAHLMAAEPRRVSGAFPSEGTAMSGFAVTESVPHHLLRLTGRHRFSRHSLTFVLTPTPSGTILSARTHAEFPGLLGAAYQRLVIRSGGHRLVVGPQLQAIRRGAERLAVR